MSPWYAVARGHKPGVYDTWAECQEQTLKFVGAMFKKFDQEEDAQAFVAKHASDKITGKPAKKKADSASKPDSFYAVARGHKPGVYRTWAECQEQIVKFGGAKYKKFQSEDEAQAFVAAGGSSSASKKEKPKTDEKKRKRSSDDDESDESSDAAESPEDKPSKSKRSREEKSGNEESPKKGSPSKKKQ